MKLIFATDAIFPPLTGIGRYALELATRLPTLADMEELRYLGMWGWDEGRPPNPDASQAPGTAPASAAAASAGLGASSHVARLRRAMATKTWAVELYDVVSEHWRRRLLRSSGHDAVLHSPNYFLPDYDGPSVATVHDLSNYLYPETHPAARRRYFELGFERSLGRADALITDSETVRQELIAQFSVNPAQVHAVHLGVDAGFRPHTAAESALVLAKHGLAQGQYLLSVSTLEPRKKLEQLIIAYADAPAALRARYPLVLIGAKGWLNDRIQPLMERAQAAGWLKYLGYVPESDLPALYAGARGFAMISAYEGFGLPLLEAMASGVPVLTSDRSCMPEITDGAALLTDPDDLANVRSQCVRLLEDEEWRLSAIGKGLSRAKRLTWERCVEQTAQVYRSVA